MSWRNMLGARNDLYTQITHNTQNIIEQGNSAYCAYSALKESELMKVISKACVHSTYRPEEIRKRVPDEVKMRWYCDEISSEELTAYAESLIQQCNMEQGKIPSNYTERAICKGCGPIWIFKCGLKEVLSCPWCFIRVSGLPIPQPFMNKFSK